MDSWWNIGTALWHFAWLDRIAFLQKISSIYYGTTTTDGTQYMLEKEGE